MKNFLLVLCMAFLPMHIMANTQDTIIGRPLKSFDLSAFCSYNSFHPSEYLTDNNWDILCAFVQSGSAAKLDSLGIPYNRSQLRLLEVGDLLMCNNEHYTTKMHIFGKSETQQIRRQSKDFADSIFPKIEPKIRRLVGAFDEARYSQQTYSLIFSYLLDNYIWEDEFLSSPRSCENHGTWSGAYWAMFESRNHDKIGTNGYGPVKQNWTDNLGYWMSMPKIMTFAREVAANGGKRIVKQEVIDAVADWGLTDENGNILIPVKKHCISWGKDHNIASQQLSQVIFYHEVMWDLLDILESKGIISMPAILKGEEVGKEHFGDICFIVLDSAAE